MMSPLTLRPDRLQESAATDKSTSTQIFGVMYITLTGLIDSMVPTSRPWAVLGKLLSYIVKLAPILWWALPAGPVGCLPASSQEPPTGWFPDMGPATDPGITWAHTEGKPENLPIERRPPRGDQSHNLTRKVEHSQFEPANGLTPAIDAIKDWENLMIRKTWAKEICESFAMTDGHTYTLDCQEDAHCHSCNKVT
ncbi:hypothetical protein DSO57_1037578 [Entomophthora muscae]|uniref:Uncharacterized protein n=1 Tax=Entomophthora muscae TaxID=34485 RepID=A0ACC2UJI2_9FUNG|nr:hypothetical protein DSO57_1037578 [Entomophthora muscae]